jgi:hypothetical protein
MIGPARQRFKNQQNQSALQLYHIPLG